MLSLFIFCHSNYVPFTKIWIFIKSLDFLRKSWPRCLGSRHNFFNSSLEAPSMSGGFYHILDVRWVFHYYLPTLQGQNVSGIFWSVKLQRSHLPAAGQLYHLEAPSKLSPTPIVARLLPPPQLPPQQWPQRQPPPSGTISLHQQRSTPHWLRITRTTRLHMTWGRRWSRWAWWETMLRKAIIQMQSPAPGRSLITRTRWGNNHLPSLMSSIRWSTMCGVWSPIWSKVSSSHRGVERSR